MKHPSILVAAVSSLFLLSAQAGTISSQGSVVALDDIQSLQGVLGLATFNEGPEDNDIPLNFYASSGLQFHANVALSAILPGVAEQGLAFNPVFVSSGPFGLQFPDPIAGGGTAGGLFALHAGVVTFTERVTQFGLTAGQNRTQYLTAWDKTGNLIGQVKWEPDNDAAFVGIDTLGVEIGLLTYGNDDILAGEFYDFGGVAIFSDDWRWASGPSVIPEGQPAALLAGSVLVGWLAMRRSRRPSAA